MSEAMGLETLAANVLGSRLNTPLTKTRTRLYGRERGYSDLDALAAAPSVGRLAIGECKAQNGARQVYWLRSDRPLLGQKYTWDLVKGARNLFRERNRWASPYLQFGCEGAEWSQLHDLELWLFANVFIDTGEADALDKRLTEEIQATAIQGLPEHVVVTAHVRSTLDLVLMGFETMQRWVTVDHWGARSGDPVLDALRELVRYKHASVSGGGSGTEPRQRVMSHYAAAISRVLLE